MKNYKLLQWYPSLPKDWEIGMKVGQGDRGSFSWYSPCSSKYSDGIDSELAKKEVEDNNEYWEEVIDYSYLLNTTFKHKESGNLYYIKAIDSDLVTISWEYSSIVYNIDSVLRNFKNNVWVELNVLFTTEDGVEIFEGDTYWCVNTAPHLWSLFEQTSKERTKLNKTVRAFSTEKLAKDYILYNKPLLSLKDINTKSFQLFEYYKLKEIAQNRL